MLTIDLNCDLGEGGVADAALMPLITSANIACGGHAGNDATMATTVRLARQHGVGLGAHPGHEDPVHFGRRELPVTPAAAAELVVRQTRRLQRIAAAQGSALAHLKLHGALYNQVSRDAALAEREARRDQHRRLAGARVGEVAAGYVRGRAVRCLRHRLLLANHQARRETETGSGRTRVNDERAASAVGGAALSCSRRAIGCRPTRRSCKAMTCRPMNRC